MCRYRAGVCITALALTLFVSSPLRAQTAREDVAARISAEIARLPKTVQAGVCVQDVSNGSVWFSHLQTQPLKPASVLKLFIMAAAIEHLGPDFAFSTDVYLHDDELWIVGGGDPGLGDPRLAERRGEQVMSVLERWADRLRGRGIRSIRKIVIDDSIFDRQFRHEDWPADQSLRWYQAPVGGLNFNDNCLDTRIFVRDARIVLEFVPSLPDSLIDNRLTLGGKHNPLIKRRTDGDVFILTGRVGKDAELGPISVRRPSLFFGHALGQALMTRDITVKQGVVRRALSPAMLSGAARIASHRTPLADVLWRIGVFSQNLFAECLLKALAAYEPDGRRRGSPGSWREGLAVLQSTLNGIGLDLNGAVFRDGSGLSHNNRVTAQQVVELLRIMRPRPHSRLLTDNLARPGENGSLRRRYRDPVLRERLWAKTGTIQGVSTLAGYLERPDGTTLVFSILMNGNTKHVREFQDAVVRILLGETPGASGSR
ncbi:MAG: D-alanyl-D-alanine carboxypeptidase/D-alanyl-D-alanine-endopeptidase [Planctomycetes bacterium]|nr:D-alanyl-D-alanine carboxypeptidase/D-alanyl-D-alanine-endopeptidase [Planctomycetota bacterium]